jgi:hypothetical protein
MKDFDEILKSKIKPKEKMALLVQELKTKKDPMKDLIAAYQKSSVPNKGYYLEALELITQESPKFIDGHLDFIVFQISANGPSIKREAAKVIANVAGTFPDKVIKAIPALLENAEDEGTVVRWSAAKGLAEIAIGNPDSRKKLLGIFDKILKREENNGVKNIYVKAIKKISKMK